MSEHRIAVIGGTGDLGFGLALRWSLAGAQIFIGSRDEKKAQDAAERLKEMVNAGGSPRTHNLLVSGCENSQAAGQASVVVMAVPVSRTGRHLEEHSRLSEGCHSGGHDRSSGRHDRRRADRDAGVLQGSVAEQVRELTPPGTPVLAAFHSLSAEALHDLSLTPTATSSCVAATTPPRKLFSPW